MVNSNFISSSSSSSSGSSSGGVTVLEPSTNSNVVICNGYVFDKRMGFNNGGDMLMACELGIADKIWSCVTLTSTGKYYNNSTKGRPIYYFKKEDLKKINYNTSIQRSTYHGYSDAHTIYEIYLVICVDIGPRYMKFIQLVTHQLDSDALPADIDPDKADFHWNSSYTYENYSKFSDVSLLGGDGYAHASLACSAPLGSFFCEKDEYKSNYTNGITGGVAVDIYLDGKSSHGCGDDYISPTDIFTLKA